MNLGRVLRPKEPRNVKITAVVCAALVLIYLLGAAFRPWSPKRGLGLIFGFLAAFAFIFEMLYPARRPRAWPLFTAKNWIQVHVYLGAVALLAVFDPRGVHLAPRNHGLGAVRPLGLDHGLRPCGGVAPEVDPLGARGGTTRGGALRADSRSREAARRRGRRPDERRQRRARPVLSHRRASFAGQAPAQPLVLLDVRSGRERALEPFRNIARFVEAGEKEKVEDLTAIYTEKLELDAHYSLQGILRSWLLFHVPPAGLLMALLAIHVWTWVWY